VKIPTARKLPSGSWFIQLRLDGQSISVTEQTEELCVAKAMAIKTGLIKIKRKPDEMTLTTAIDKYIEDRSNLLSPATIREYKQVQRNRFPDLMKRKIGDITARDIQQTINAERAPNEQGKALSPKTIYNAYGLMKSVLDEHIDIDLRKIKLPQKEEYTANVLTPDEVGKLIVGLRGNVAEIPILLAVWLGLRRSEIAALRRSDFDFERGAVTIRAARVLNSDGKYVEKGTKTTKSTRTLDCPQYILDRVAELPKDGEYLIKLYPGTIYKVLQKVCEVNGLPKVRLHDLRHVAASIMEALGVPEKYAMGRGGWSSKQTMRGRYQHIYSEEQQRINTRIDKYYTELVTSADNKNANENANKENES